MTFKRGPKRIGKDFPAAGDYYRCVTRTNASVTANPFLSPERFQFVPGDLVVIIDYTPVTALFTVLFGDRILYISRQAVCHMFEHILPISESE